MLIPRTRPSGDRELLFYAEGVSVCRGSFGWSIKLVPSAAPTVVR